VPVFDLAALLGYPPVTSLRWLVITDRASPTALAFDQFERIELLPTDAFGAVPPGGGGASQHAAQVVRTSDGPRPLINVATILGAIDGRIPQRPER
jgi:chemotaxis signal transduction protein